jgi:hypothetical protein
MRYYAPKKSKVHYAPREDKIGICKKTNGSFQFTDDMNKVTCIGCLKVIKNKKLIPKNDKRLLVMPMKHYYYRGELNHLGKKCIPSRQLKGKCLACGRDIFHSGFVDFGDMDGHRSSHCSCMDSYIIKEVKDKDPQKHSELLQWIERVKKEYPEEMAQRVKCGDVRGRENELWIKKYGEVYKDRYEAYNNCAEYYED